jgi:prepilin-type N-terminal cleavage/methylation domain-containing protein
MNGDNKKAFTLIEMLIVVMILSLIIVVATGFLVSSIKVQRQELNSQRITDQVSYFLDYVTRSLRMAVKATDDTCIASGKNYEIPIGGPGGGNSQIKFLAYNDQTQALECRFFYLEAGRFMFKINDEDAVPLSSADYNISSLSFYILGGNDSSRQPRVVFYAKMESKDLQSMLRLQTTVSQRNLNN